MFDHCQGGHKMKIDRITFVGDVAKHLIKKCPLGEYIHLDKILAPVLGFTRKTSAKFPYRWQLVADDGFTIQIADMKASVPQLRIDFNPETTEYKHHLKSFLRTMVNVRVTRLDYAHDYDLNLSNVKFQLQRMVKTCTFRSGSGKLETLYLGAKDSPLRFRIYDKAKEQGETGTKWRIEAQARFSKNDDWFYFQPFENFVMCNPNYENLKIQEKALLEYLINHDAWHELDAKTRKKYKELMKGNLEDSFFLHPHKIYEQDSLRIKKQVLEILSLTEYKPSLYK